MASIDLENPNVHELVFQDALPLANDATPMQVKNFNNCWIILEKESHGNLDLGNMSGLASINYANTRRGSLVDGWSVGGTANLDYLAYSYQHIDPQLWNSRNDIHIQNSDVIMHAVAGGSRTFFLRNPALVDFRWNIFWGNDMPNVDYRSQSHIAFIVDGVKRAHFVRSCGPSTEGVAGAHGNPYETNRMEGYKANRVWTGHALQPLAAGEHTVQLAHVSNRHIPLSRVWVRGMRALIFPQRDEF